MKIKQRLKITEDDWEWPDRRALVIEWAKANNLVPENVVAAPGDGIPALVIENGQIHWHEFIRDEKGRTQVAPDGNALLSVARVSPLLVPYPARGASLLDDHPNKAP